MITQKEYYRILEQLSELKSEVDGLKSRFYLQTDPILYTDVFGGKGYYRRIGKEIEFTASQPPCGINIITDTLHIKNGKRVAEVIGWSNNQEYYK